jgi:ubiquinone/menaquinone biosynthesis C-methylase UbiE
MLEQRLPDGGFDRVARSYDLLCALNPGYKKHLRLSASRLEVARDARLLDLCCGTGLSTEALRTVHPNAAIDALDSSPGMLALAREKRLERVRWLEGDAMNPAAAGAAGPYDGILMAYGIRNVPDADLCLARLLELLRPGGTIVFHEYSVAASAVSRAVWRTVSSAVILPLGRLAGSGPLFAYLRESVLGFDGVPAFEARLRRAGLVDVETLPMDGWQRGIVHSFRARRRA